MVHDRSNDSTPGNETPSAITSMKGPVTFLLIMVVVAAVGMTPGPEGSGLLAALLYFLGVIAMCVAIITTIFIANAAAPVLVERAPVHLRSLCTLGIIVLWASTPIWIYYLIHDLPLNFGALVDYFEFRGFFVAKLFVVGIVAFAVARHQHLEHNAEIKPYILIPVASIFLAVWLAPEDDRAALRAGLSIPLVYYIGVTIAASVGYFLGQVARKNANVPERDC